MENYTIDGSPKGLNYCEKEWTEKLLEIIRETFPPSLNKEYAKSPETYTFTVTDANQQAKRIEVIRAIVEESLLSSQITYYSISGYRERLIASFVIRKIKKRRTLLFVLETKSETPIFEGANFSNDDPVEIIVIRGDMPARDKLVIRDLFN